MTQQVPYVLVVELLSCIQKINMILNVVGMWPEYSRRDYRKISRVQNYTRDKGYRKIMSRTVNFTDSWVQKYVRDRWIGRERNIHNNIIRPTLLTSRQSFTPYSTSTTVVYSILHCVASCGFALLSCDWMTCEVKRSCKVMAVKQQQVGLLM